MDAIPDLAPPKRMGGEVQRIFDALVDDILAGRLGPDEKLSEPALARRFGVSRGPLREAIRRLEERQLVRRTPNFGARVAHYTPQEILEHYAIREALEGLAARLAAENIAEEELIRLREVFEAEVSRGYSGGYQKDFHMRIVRGSHNSRLIRLLGEDYYRLFKLWRRHAPWLQSGGPESWDDHRRILEAIEERDPEVAELLMRRHIARLRRESRERLQREEAQAAGA